jgi:Domain of unknown function (DUF4153)
MAAILDAGWVVAIDVVAAWLLATVAVAGRTLTAVGAPFRSLRAAPELAPAITPRSLVALRGAVVGCTVVVPFLVLFWTADAVFAELGRSIPLPSWSLSSRLAVFTLVLLGAVGLALARSEPRQRALVPRRRLEPLEWGIALALLNLLFAVFVGVQLTVLFGGREHVLSTAGLTYAEYARQGFWQLLVVAGLTVAVVTTAALTATTRRRRDVVLLRSLLCSLCVLTIVVVASALHRLGAYEDAFGLTRSRLAAEAAAWGLAALFLLVVAALLLDLVRRRLDAVVLYSAAVGLLAFSLSSPDARIAQRNVHRWQTTGLIDLAYARGLSADAVPALDRLPEPLRGKVLAPYEVRLARAEPLGSANLSRRRARSLLASDG